MYLQIHCTHKSAAENKYITIMLLLLMLMNQKTNLMEIQFMLTSVFLAECYCIKKVINSKLSYLRVVPYQQEAPWTSEEEKQKKKWERARKRQWELDLSPRSSYSKEKWLHIWTTGEVPCKGFCSATESNFMALNCRFKLGTISPGQLNTVPNLKPWYTFRNI